MTEPQTPEQVIAGVLVRRFGPVLGGEAHLSEIAAEVVAALGLREETGEYRFVDGRWALGECVRDVTPWRPKERPADV